MIRDRFSAVIDGPHPTLEPFSAERVRVRTARAFLLIVMPCVLVLVTVLTIFEWLRGAESVPTTLLLANAAFWIVQVALTVPVVLGRADPVPIAGAVLVLGAAIEFAALFASPEPVASASSLVFFVVTGAYFLRPRTTVAFTIATTIAICWAANAIDAWGPHFLLPSTAFVILVTGTLAAFVISRTRRTEQQLERVASEERDARERLEQVDASRHRLIANVSHELRTPLTSTIGAIETLLRTDVRIDEGTRQELLRIARDGGLRLLVLVEDLLTIGSTRPDSLELTSGPERLAAIARDAVLGLDPGQGREIRIAATEIAPVRVDRMRLLQVVTNLVVNAIRHGRGDVLVRVGVADGHALLTVLDDGDGVPDDHVDELFLPFARFSTREDSTGLGLAICRTIVEAHGGTIRYERTEDQHTAFVVELPIDV